MKKSLLTLLTGLLLGICPVMADVTFTVNVPAGTQQCFVTGELPELTNWSAGAAVAMTKVDGKDQFTVTIAGITADDVKASKGYKYLCGPSWDYVEKTASGGEVSNRTTIGNPDVVAKWLKVYESVGITEVYTINGKDYPVQILLPSNYDASNTYPVTYMFGRHMRYRDAGDDAQMGDRILYSDSWGVAGQVADMEAAGTSIGIVAVIYAQLPEFTPWENPEFMGTGKANDFITSVVEDFIPAFESKYNVIQDKTARTITGADVAGLFALYSTLEYPNVFGSCGMFSPSIWYNKADLMSYLAQYTPQHTNTKFALTTAVQDMAAMQNDCSDVMVQLQQLGYTDMDQLRTAGMHDDKTWGSQFTAVIQYLKGITQEIDKTNQDNSSSEEDEEGDDTPSTDYANITWRFSKGESSSSMTCTDYTTQAGFFYKDGVTASNAQLLMVEIPVDSKKYDYYWNLNDNANCSGNTLMDAPKTIGFKDTRKTIAWQRVAVFEDGSYIQSAASSTHFTINDKKATTGSNYTVSASIDLGTNKNISVYYGSVNSGSKQDALATVEASDNCTKATVTYSYLTNQLTITETAWGEVEEEEETNDDIDIAYFRGEPAVVRVGTPVTVKIKFNSLNGCTVAYRMNHNNQSSTAVNFTKGSNGEYTYTIESPQSGIYGFYLDRTKDGTTKKAYCAIYVKVLEGKIANHSIHINPYANIDWSKINQYKGNFHTHTTQSNDAADGFTTAYVVDKYHQAGYKILALTDHDYNPYPWTMFPQFMPGVEARDPEKLGMLAVPGNELSKDNTNNWAEQTGGQFNHHNDFFTGRQGQEFASLQESYAYTYALGGLQIINHPGQYWDISTSYNETTKNGPGWHATNFKTYPSLIGLEVYNQGNRRPNDRILWDQILDRTMPTKAVFGYSCDDAHNDDQLFRNYNFMLMEELTTDELKDAMVKGETYFCYEPKGSGEAKAPRINAITVDENAQTITIDTKGVVKWIYSTDKTSTAASSRRSTVVGIGNTFCYKGFQGTYVRALITNQYGETCTQPISFFDPNYDYTAVNEVESTPLTMVLYPNPTTSQISVFMNEAAQEEEIAIFDLNGKQVMSKKVDGETTILPTENLVTGMYIVKSGNRTGKFIKQ